MWSCQTSGRWSYWAYTAYSGCLQASHPRCLHSVDHPIDTTQVCWRCKNWRIGLRTKHSKMVSVFKAPTRCLWRAWSGWSLRASSGFEKARTSGAHRPGPWRRWCLGRCGRWYTWLRGLWEERIREWEVSFWRPTLVLGEMRGAMVGLPMSQIRV